MSGNIRFNILFKLGCVSMLSIIGFGAKYGHVGQLPQESVSLFFKAQFYNLSNCVGFFASSLIASPSIPLKVAACSLIAGQLLFVLPMYLAAINGKQKILSGMMPIGGTSMLIGWTSMLFA